MDLAAVVLAAGKGTRMKSRRPKVLHHVAGRPMVAHVIEAVREAGAHRIIVITGYGHDEVAAVVNELGGETVVQEPQLGTAHAVLQAEERLAGHWGHVLVVCGDTPLLRADTLSGLVARHRDSGAAATVLTAFLGDPTGYGRVIRDPAGRFIRIVEQADGTPEELAVREISTGVFCFTAGGLFECLRGISADNRQGEYYLPDALAVYLDKGFLIGTCPVADPVEIYGINDRRQLAEAERLVRSAVLDYWMDQGVTIVDPSSTYIDRAARIAKDTVIYPFTFIEGNSVVGEECEIGPNTRLVRARLGDRVSVQYAVVLESTVGEGSTVGPFAYIRPGCEIGAGVKIGDFVEIKKSVVGTGSKIPHLSYVGDAVIGERVNVGAGTITCNYDGKKKWTTVIEDGAFIGSNTNLVAPVTVGRGAYVGAGSTIRRDVPPGALGVARSEQKNIPNWETRVRHAEKDDRQTGDQ
ncbi:MAG: bifunctional UDP-N-acetylglucosamine diphosphorylase/glucosamine-1-phosphate N-acetyltransferase GlmU [Bacillota bacterium]